MSDAEKARKLLKANRARQLLKEAASKYTPKEPKRAKHSIGKTAVEHTGEGLSMGFSDNIAGLMNKGLDYMAGDKSPYAIDRKLKEQGFTGDLLPDSPYEDGRDDKRQLLEETADDNPKTALASDMIAGTVPGVLATAVAGPAGLAAEGATLGVGYGDGDNVGEMAQDGVIGGAVGKYGGKVLSKAAALGGKALKKVTPEMTNSIYSALRTKVGAKQPEKVKEAIGRLEERFGLFTGQEGATITPEAAATSLSKIYSNVNSELNIITEKMGSNVRTDKLKGQFLPMVKKLEGMKSTVLKNTTNTALANNLTKSAALLKDAINSGDYKRIVKIMNDEMKERYVSYNALGEAQVSKAIRGEMKQLLGDFDTKNVALITSVLGEDSGKMFKEGMKDLSSYYKVNELVSKNVGQEGASLAPRVQELVASSFIGFLTNKMIGAGYMAGSMLLRQSKVQGFMAKNFKQIGRGTDGAKKLLSSPLAPFFKEHLPEEISALVNKMEAGITLPRLQQQLVVKSLTSQFPEFFEYSEYESVVDGRITDPYEVDAAKAKIKEDDSLSNVEKYKRTTALNKDGTIISPDTNATAKGTVKPISESEQQEIGNFLQQGMSIRDGNN